jgi:hypothetical protein
MENVPFSIAYFKICCQIPAFAGMTLLAIGSGKV